MNERELRLLRTLVDNLRAISQEIHAIHENQQADDNSDNDQIVQPRRVEMADAPNLGQTWREYYEAENRERNSVWSKLKPWVEGIAVATALALAILTSLNLQEVKEQTAIAEQQNRPWIKIMDIAIVDPTNETPSLSFTSMPMVRRLDNGQPQTFTQPVVNISVEITVKNIGKGVARDIYIVPVLRFYKLNSTGIPGRDEERICTQATRSNPGTPFAWSSVFPDEARTSRIQTLGFYDGDMYFHRDDRKGNWISGVLFGCVSYQPSISYQTSAVFDVMGEKDRFVEVGRSLMSKQLHLLRDEHFEYAQ